MSDLMDRPRYHIEVRKLERGYTGSGVPLWKPAHRPDSGARHIPLSDYGSEWEARAIMAALPTEEEARPGLPSWDFEYRLVRVTQTLLGRVRIVREVEAVEGGWRPKPSEAWA